MHEHPSSGPRAGEPQASADALERRAALLLLLDVAVWFAFATVACLAVMGAGLALTHVPLWWPFWVGAFILALPLGYLNRAVGRRLRQAQDELRARQGGR